MTASAFDIVRYTPEMKGEWDAFVAGARNATFLFRRDYMDYHADRFRDCSWIARKGNRTVALLPANITPDGVLHSHQGLTYGGWILPQAHLNGEDLLSIFRLASDRWRADGIRELDYKPLPSIYPAHPSQEDLYALFRLGAVISDTTLSTTLLPSAPLPMNKLRRRALASASRLPFIIEETDDCHAFMKLVEECLAERHDARPVHTAAELSLLRFRFPDNIRLFTLRCADTPENSAAALEPRQAPVRAGVCIFDTGRVAHTQYIATDSAGRRLNLLTPLFRHLIGHTFRDRAYFDFGTSNTPGAGNSDLHLNAGLLRQKTSFGASGTVHLRFRLTL